MLPFEMLNWDGTEYDGSKPFTLLWRNNNIESFLLILHHQERPSTELLNSLQQLQVCD
jgi:hypothetical protein